MHSISWRLSRIKTGHLNERIRIRPIRAEGSAITAALAGMVAAEIVRDLVSQTVRVDVRGVVRVLKEPAGII